MDTLLTFYDSQGIIVAIRKRFTRDSQEQAALIAYALASPPTGSVRMTVDVALHPEKEG